MAGDLNAQGCMYLKNPTPPGAAQATSLGSKDNEIKYLEATQTRWGGTLVDDDWLRGLVCIVNTAMRHKRGG